MSIIYVDTIEPKTSGNNVSIPLDIPIIKLKSASGESISNATFTALTLGTTVFDTHTLKDGNGFTITSATAGYYSIQSQVRLNNYNPFFHRIKIKNNGTVIGMSENSSYGNTTTPYAGVVYTNVHLLANGDTITMDYYQNSGGSRTTYVDDEGVFLLGWRIK